MSRNTTIVVSLVVSSAVAASALRSSRPLAHASPMAPRAPSAPASEGVATPAKMLPSTSPISASGGSITHTIFPASSRRLAGSTSGGSAGAERGLKMATPTT